MNGLGGLDYSRVLRALGHPKDSILEVWRGNVLAYKIIDIGWGQERTIREDKNRGPYIGKFTPMDDETKIRLKQKRKAIG